MNHICSASRLFNSSQVIPVHLISNYYSHSFSRSKLKHLSGCLKYRDVKPESLSRTFPLLPRHLLLQKGCNSTKSPSYLSSFHFHIQNKHLGAENDNKDTTFNKSKPDQENSHIEEAPRSKDEESLSLIQKFKLMYKQYWYVLIPVHVVTSTIWYGAFFFSAKSGVDIVPLLENMGATEKFLSYLRNSNAGYYGIAYAMYKIATPARYTVTLGGTTIAINYLKNRGYIKPVPTKEELKEMYEDKREEFIERTEEMREKYQEKRNELLEKYQDKTDEMKEKYQERKTEFLDKYKINKHNSEKKEKR